MTFNSTFVRSILARVRTRKRQAQLVTSATGHRFQRIERSASQGNPISTRSDRGTNLTRDLQIAIQRQRLDVSLNRPRALARIVRDRSDRSENT